MSTPIASRASAGNPCAVCGSESKGCSVTVDALYLCRGEALDAEAWLELSPATAEGFRGLRRREDAKPKSRARKASTPKPKPGKATIEIDWPAEAKKFASQITPAWREQLATRLGLPVEALEAVPLLGVSGADENGIVYAFPETDAAGVVLGITDRAGDGSKKMRLFGHHGITITAGAAGWKSLPGPIFLVEGASDTLALAAAGLAAIGRPSNMGGVEYLAKLLAAAPADRPIIVVGENDKKDKLKPNGEIDWPGREGAITTATKLADQLGRVIGWTLPPAEAKDVRAWLTDPLREDAISWHTRGDILRTRLELSTTFVDPTAATLAVAKAELESSADAPEGDNPAKWDSDPENPVRLASAFLAHVSPSDRPLTLRFWREEFHEWREGAYHTLRDSEISARITRWLIAEFSRVFRLEVSIYNVAHQDTAKPPKKRPITTALVSNVANVLRSLTAVSGEASPAWLDGAAGPNPATLVALRNGIYNLATGELLPLSSSYFNFAVAPYDFAADAPRPVEWLRFLGELFPDRPAEITCLQEWLGYLLSPDTRQQKLLFIVGPRRAGKGTIARIISQLVGEENVGPTTFGTMAGNFGLWPLVGKSVAMITDARLSGKTDISAVVENILRITGEDRVNIDRKNLPTVNTKLNSRFVIMSNDLPNMNDASGALAGRMILLRLTETFYGREDLGLGDRLTAELPGVLLWAIEGYRRLAAQRRFTIPASSVEAMGEMEDLGSPVSVFVREECILEPGAKVYCQELYESWVEWCKRSGRREPNAKQVFGRNLNAAFSQIGSSRDRVLGTKNKYERSYTGVRLRTTDDDNRTNPADDLLPGIKNGSETDLAAESVPLVPHDENTSGTRQPLANPMGVPLVPLVPIQVSNPYITRTHAHAPAHTQGVPSGSLSGTSDATGTGLENQAESVFRNENVTAEQAERGAIPWLSEGEHLYFSKRLELSSLPNGAGLTCQIGSTVYYRLTPTSLVWIELAANNAKVDGAQREELVEVLGLVLDFADAHLDVAEVKAARAKGKPVLPVHADIPA